MVTSTLSAPSTARSGLRLACCGATLLSILTAAPVHAQGDGWRRITPTETVVGADGQPHRATCSGFPGTDPTYSFWVRRGDPDKLAVLFDGGGACWDDATCSTPYRKRATGESLQFYRAAIAKGERPSRAGGMLDLDNPANPTQDWTVVVLPYCTGDAHIGSADHTYRNAADPAAGLPDTFTIHHRGYDNFMVVLDWMARQLPAPSQLLVSGTSAGGYGASFNFPWLAEQYPSAQLSVLADASQGVLPEVLDTDWGPTGRTNWNPQGAPWVIGDDPLRVPTHEALFLGAQAYPQGRFAQFTHNLDALQIGFYAYAVATSSTVTQCADPTADWNRQMLSQLGDYAALPNHRAFVMEGDAHTVLGVDASFYDDRSAGTTFAAWLGDMLAPDRASSDGWTDAACPDCLTPLPCP